MANTRLHIPLSVDVNLCKDAFRDDHVRAVHLPGVARGKSLAAIARLVDDIPGNAWRHLLYPNGSPTGDTRFTCSSLENQYTSMYSFGFVLAEQVYNPIARQIGLKEWPEGGEGPRLAVTRYAPGSAGIPYHQDTTLDMDFILTVRGKGVFRVARSRDGKGEVPYEVTPGSGVLMTSLPKERIEHPILRSPPHAADSMDEGRTIITAHF